MNAAIGSQHDVDDQGQDVVADSYTTKSVGGFANLRLASPWLASGGLNRTAQLDDALENGSKTNDYTSHLQGFVAVQYLLAEQLYIKAVFAYAHATFQASNTSVPIWNNDMYSGRIRLMYLY